MPNRAEQARERVWVIYVFDCCGYHLREPDEFTVAGTPIKYVCPNCGASAEAHPVEVLPTSLLGELVEDVDHLIERIEVRGKWSGLVVMDELELWVKNDLRPFADKLRSLLSQEEA